MFVIVDISGKQYQVTEKNKLLVDKLDNKEGDKVLIDKVLLYVSDGEQEIEIGRPYLPYEVELKVLAHTRGDKIRVFKMRSKKRYRRTKGHRQEYTEVEVVKITKKDGVKVVAPKIEAKEVVSAVKKTTIRKAPAKKKVVKVKTV